MKIKKIEIQPFIPLGIWPQVTSGFMRAEASVRPHLAQYRAQQAVRHPGFFPPTQGPLALTCTPLVPSSTSSHFLCRAQFKCCLSDPTGWSQAVTCHPSVFKPAVSMGDKRLFPWGNARKWCKMGVFFCSGGKGVGVIIHLLPKSLVESGGGITSSITSSGITLQVCTPAVASRPSHRWGRRQGEKSPQKEVDTGRCKAGTLKVQRYIWGTATIAETNSSWHGYLCRYC